MTTDLSAWRNKCPLRVWRGLHKRLQADVARLCGVSQTTVQNWERGSYAPREDRMEKITALTGITSQTWEIWFREMELD